MKIIIAAIPLVSLDVTAEVPEPGNVRGVAFVPSDRRIRLPNTPPDMPVVWIEVDPTARLQKRRFVVVPNGRGIEERENERAIYVGTSVSGATGMIVHVYEVINDLEESARRHDESIAAIEASRR